MSIKGLIKVPLKNWIPGLLVVLAGILWFTLVATTWAEASDKQENKVKGNDDDEYSFSWLDPEKKIYVLQNRKYLKSPRLLVSVTGGVGISNAYRSVYSVDPRIGFFFSEAFGIEGFYTANSNSSNSN